MARKLKRPLGRKLRRNPFARALGEPRYRKRVVKSKDAYRRRPKHVKKPETEGDGQKPP